MAKFLDYTGLSYLWGKITTALSDKMDKLNPRGKQNLIISGRSDVSSSSNDANCSVWASKNLKNAYCGVRSDSTGYDQLYLASYSNSTKSMYVTTSAGDSLELLHVDDNNNISGPLAIPIAYKKGSNFSITFNAITGLVTSGQTDFYVFIPMPFCEKLPDVSTLSISVVFRHVDGGYVYYKCGSPAGYVALGSDYVTIWNNGQTQVLNGINNVYVNNLSYGGFTLRINFKSALAKDSSGTAMKNNTPVAAMIQLSGFIQS